MFEKPHLMVTWSLVISVICLFGWFGLFLTGAQFHEKTGRANVQLLKGISPPATCGPGDIFINTNLLLDLRLCTCNTSNQWQCPFAGAATLDFPEIASGSGCDDLTLTATGAHVGDPVALGWPASVPARSMFTARVTATNTVTVRHCAQGGSPDPGSGTFKVAGFSTQ